MSRRTTKQRRAASRRQASWSRWRDRHGDYAHVWASGNWLMTQRFRRVFENPIVNLLPPSASVMLFRGLADSSVIARIASPEGS